MLSKLKESAAVVLAVALVFVSLNSDALSQARSTTGSNLAESDANKEQFDIPMDLWNRGFVSSEFTAKDVKSGGVSVRLYTIKGTFDGDHARLVFNVIGVVGNYKNGIDNRFKRVVKSFAPKYVDAGRSKLRVRSGVGRITKTDIDGCKYFVAAINVMRGSVFGEVCGEAITQVTEILREFRVSSPEENRISYNLNRRSQESASTAASSSVGDQRDVAFTWAKFDGPLNGSIDIQNPTNIKVDLPQGVGTCDGFFEVKDRTANTGTWFLKCSEGSSASGAFRGNGAGLGSTGDGYDNDGNSVSFTIGAR